MAYGQHGSSAGGGLRKALSWVFYIVFVIGLVWLLQNFVVCPYTIPSGSMEDTIEVGDNVWSEKITYYTHEPQAGDIVTFEDPEIAGRTLIKRVIATGGQTVDLIDGTVYIDGEALNETQFGIENGITFHPYDGYEALVFPQTVPKGCVFVLGDNRTVSRDSRYAEIGMIDTRHIMGEAVFTLYPFDRFGFVKTNENN